MNLRQLQYVVALADHGTLTRASQLLNVSQPALSRGIHELEAELGAQLVRRKGRGLELTEAGILMVDAARSALAALSAVRKRVDPRAEPPLLRVAVTPSMAPLFSGRLAAVLGRLPKLNTQLLPVKTEAEAAELLLEAHADLAFGDISTCWHGLETQPLGSLEVVLISPSGTKLPRPPSLSDLAGVPFLCPPKKSDRRKLVDALFQAANVAPTVVFETEDSSAFVPAVRAGIGSTFVWLPNLPDLSGIEARSMDPPWIIKVGCLYPSRPTRLTRDLVRLLAATPLYARLDKEAATS